MYPKHYLYWKLIVLLFYSSFINDGNFGVIIITTKHVNVKVITGVEMSSRSGKT